MPWSHSLGTDTGQNCAHSLQATQALAAKGIKVGPLLPTSDGGRLVFISPKATHGVLLQFIERPKP